jgi:Cu+-exporting ATPase
MVFDKTGTLTDARDRTVRFIGAPLTPVEKRIIASIAGSSFHPLSRTIARFLAVDGTHPPETFTETPGAGIEGTIAGVAVRLGSAGFAGSEWEREEGDEGETNVVVALDGSVRGHFAVGSRYRAGVGDLFKRLRKRYRLHVLSGDTERERGKLEGIVGGEIPLRFRQSPTEKREYVAALQGEHEAVLMVGDGLNDAGALRTADVGIAVSDDIAAFSPACDAIVDGRMLPRLDAMLALSRVSITFVLTSFSVSLLYNIAVLTIAVRGDLSPIVAAILMPLSSITVILLAAGSVQWAARRKGLL